jgi:hypothetical protein
LKYIGPKRGADIIQDHVVYGRGKFQTSSPANSDKYDCCSFLNINHRICSIASLIQTCKLGQKKLTPLIYFLDKKEAEKQLSKYEYLLLFIPRVLWKSNYRLDYFNENGVLEYTHKPEFSVGSVKTVFAKWQVESRNLANRQLRITCTGELPKQVRFSNTCIYFCSFTV